MKIDANDYRVEPGKKVKLDEWPTLTKPFYASKKKYQELLAEHVDKLSDLQQLHYALNRYALLIIFQTRQKKSWVSWGSGSLASE